MNDDAKSSRYLHVGDPVAITGYLHTELGLAHRRHRRLRHLLGGAVPGLDVLTRSHVYLLQAVARLLAEDPGLADVLELHLAGVLSEDDRAVGAQTRSSITWNCGCSTWRYAVAGRSFAARTCSLILW